MMRYLKYLSPPALSLFEQNSWILPFKWKLLWNSLLSFCCFFLKKTYREKSLIKRNSEYFLNWDLQRSWEWCGVQKKEHCLCIGLTVYCVRDQKIKCQWVFLMQFSRFFTYRVWIDSNAWVSTFLNVWQLEIRTRIFENVPGSCDFLMLSTVIQRNKELKRVISAALIGHVTGPALRWPPRTVVAVDWISNY